jgi:hypothetical protein
LQKKNLLSQLWLSSFLPEIGWEESFPPVHNRSPERSCRKRTYYHNFGYQAFYLRKGEKSGRSCRKRTYYHNFGYQAFYLRKGEKNLLPQATTDHQGEVAEKELITTALAIKLLLRKGEKGPVPQNTKDHQGEVAEKELITTTLAIKLFTWERVRRVFSPRLQQITREQLQKKNILPQLWLSSFLPEKKCEESSPPVHKRSPGRSCRKITYYHNFG